MRSLPAILLASAIFLTGFVTIIEPDVPWMLKTGELIVKEGGIPAMDVFSYTSTIPWLNHEWLSQVLFYGAYSVGGFSLLGAIQGLILLCLSAIAWMYRQKVLSPIFKGGPSVVEAVLFVSIVLLLREKISIRAQALTNVFLALSFLLFALQGRAKTKGRVSNILFLGKVAALGFFWTQIHGGAPHLVILSGAFSLVQGTRLSAVCLLVAIVATFLGPHGWHVHRHFLDSHSTLPQIREWHSIIDAFQYFPIFFLLSMMIGSLTFVALVKRFKDFQFETCVFLVFALASLMYIRFFQELLVIALLLAPMGAVAITDRFKTKPTKRSILSYRGITWLTFASVLPIILAVGLWGRRDVGVGLSDKKFPISAVDFVATNNLHGPLFNSYNFGGYLIWALPREKVFIDGRAFTVYTEQLMNDLVSVYDHPPNFLELERKYGFRLAIVQREGRGHALPSFMISHGWKIRYQDSLAIVLTK